MPSVWSVWSEAEYFFLGNLPVRTDLTTEHTETTESKETCLRCVQYVLWLYSNFFEFNPKRPLRDDFWQ